MRWRRVDWRPPTNVCQFPHWSPGTLRRGLRPAVGRTSGAGQGLGCGDGEECQARRAAEHRYREYDVATAWSLLLNRYRVSCRVRA